MTPDSNYVKKRNVGKKSLDEMFYAPDVENIDNMDSEGIKHVEENCLDEMFYAPDLEDLFNINLEAEDKLVGSNLGSSINNSVPGKQLVPVNSQAVHFEEDDVDQFEFNRELQEQQRNKLYSIFNREKAVLGTPVSFASGTKRKISPGAPSPMNSCPRTSLMHGRTRKLSFGDVYLPAQGRDRCNTTSGVVEQRKKKTVRQRSNSVKNEYDLMKSQRLINDMLIRKIVTQQTGEDIPDTVTLRDEKVPDLN